MILFLILCTVMASKASDLALIDDACTMSVVVGNVSLLNKDQSIHDTTEYDSHRLNGFIVKVDINDHSANIKSCRMIYKFFETALNKMEMSISDYFNIWLNGKEGTKVIINQMPVVVQSMLHAMKKKAKDMVVNRSEWRQTFPANDVYTEHAINFYLTSIELIKQIHGKNLIVAPGKILCEIPPSQSFNNVIKNAAICDIELFF